MKATCSGDLLFNNSVRMPRALACALVAMIAWTAAACSARKVESEPAAAGTSAAGTAAPLPRKADIPDSAVPAAATDRAAPILAGSRQLVVGVAESWNAVDVQLWFFERTDKGVWERRGEPWPGVLGASGLAWGRGLHGDGAPAGQSEPVKREGDGRSPAGVFALTHAYGYANSGLGSLPYQPVTRAWKCIDDSKSGSYNRIIDITGVAKDWSSAEDMRRRDGLYEWVIEIAHNQGTRGPVVGGGSCIFFHVWRTQGAGTAGCTAMARERMTMLLAALDPAAAPVYVLLPRHTYDTLAPSWSLPPLPGSATAQPAQ